MMKKKLSEYKKYKTVLILISVLLFVLPLLAMAAEGEEGEEGAPNDDEPIYYELSPPFVVNLRDTGGRRIHFLQARIQVLAYGQKKIDKVKEHEAPIRDALITLLSAQGRADINTSKKKKALQEKALKAVKKVLKSETGRVQIEGLYFTNFVVQ